MILLTGSSGFVGSRFLESYQNPEDLRTVSLQETDVSEIDFEHIDTVVHLAGVAHRMEKTFQDLYFDINRDLAMKMANRAKKVGVSLFLFMSTVKVYGKDQGIINAKTPLQPKEPYGRSKLEAEQALLPMQDDNFRVAIVRPPLIYGPGAKGNLHRLMQMIQGNGLLPLGGIDNRRSMIGIDNLIDYLSCIIKNQEAGIFLPVDNPSVSTTRLVELMRDVLHPNKKLISLPGVIRSLIKLIKPDVYSRLFRDLVIDPEDIEIPRGYIQLRSVEEGISAMAKGFN